jgi:uncharacterized protein
MVKQILLPIIAVAAFIVIVGVLVKKPSLINLNLNNIVRTSTVKPSPFENPSGKYVIILGKRIDIEEANTKALRTKGLSERKTLAENSGMLFIFDSQNVTTAFWMKDMLIPLDIIWINDGKIVQIDKDLSIPAVGAQDSSLKTYKPSSVIDYVLEVNGGFSDNNNIKVGDSVDLSKI